MATACDVLVPLRDGPAVPMSVVLWLSNAESRGLRLRAEPDGLVHVGPRALVQDDDLEFIREHRASVRATLAYIEGAWPC